MGFKRHQQFVAVPRPGDDAIAAVDRVGSVGLGLPQLVAEPLQGLADVAGSSPRVDGLPGAAPRGDFQLLKEPGHERREAGILDGFVVRAAPAMQHTTDVRPGGLRPLEDVMQHQG